jgi:hypothetical protein
VTATGRRLAAARSVPLSLTRLLEPETLADPYALYRQLREERAVHWDPYLHAFVVTRYDDVMSVLSDFSADRTPRPERLEELGLGKVAPIAAMMVRQMLFLDPPAHQRTRRLVSVAFTPRRVEALREHIGQITDSLLAKVRPRGEMDLMAELANPLPAIVIAEMLGVPSSDHRMLKEWSQDFAEMLGNFQHNPGRTEKVLRNLVPMTEYFRAAIDKDDGEAVSGLAQALSSAEVEGDRLSDDEMIANLIMIMVGGQETTSNLIGNGVLTLLRNPAEAERLRADKSLLSSGIEELLRYESPSQHTARLAPADVDLAGTSVQRGQAVIAVMAAANRDPEYFVDPDRFDVARADNRHLAFGWAGHFCFGASLARLEAQIVFDRLLDLPGLRRREGPVEWRRNLGLRGLTALNIAFDP